MYLYEWVICEFTQMTLNVHKNQASYIQHLIYTENNQDSRSTLVKMVIINITTFNQDITNYDQPKNFVLMSISSLLYLTLYNKDKYGKNPKQDKRFGKFKDLKIMGLN